MIRAKLDTDHFVTASDLSRIIFLVAKVNFRYVFAQNHWEYEV